MARDLADMESTLEITVIAAKGLKDVKTFRKMFGKMNVYVDAHLSGGESSKNQRTPVHKDGGTNPSWGHAIVFTFDGAAARAGCLTLHFRIKAQRTHRSDKDVGQVDVPVRELLEQGGAGDGKPKVLSYNVRLPSGKTKGVLEFSYKFDERFTVAALPPEADEPAMGYPAAAAPPASNSVAAYPPPMQGAVPYPPMPPVLPPPGPHPLAGYPPRAYPPPGPYPPPGAYPPLGARPPPGPYPPPGAYPPPGPYPAQAGPGHAAPPPAQQKIDSGNVLKDFVGRLTANVAADGLMGVLGSINDA